MTYKPEPIDTDGIELPNHLTEVKPRRGVELPSPLLLLLRKHVRGARIAAVRNPPFERILEIEMGKEKEIEIEKESVTLIVEAMGRHANVILVDGDGTVLEAIKRVGPRMSRVRPILPGRPYARPPLSKTVTGKSCDR